jgi:2-dehydro-3-deoxygluconokinase
MELRLRPADECTYDIVSLGEILLRLDPGDSRIRCAREFKAWEGGGEYNVARGLRKCFGQRAAVVTSLVDNEVGRLIEDFILQGGIDASWIKWLPFDGIGAAVRNGLNFTERGFGVRGALSIPDRGSTAATKLAPGDIEWDRLFGEYGTRWLHTGGIFAALSDMTAQTVIEAVKAAKKRGTVVSYDLNYRASLWKSKGGLERAREVNKSLAAYVDVMIGNEEDFTACLGLEVEGNDANLTELNEDGYGRMMRRASEIYPNFRLIASTLRRVKTATVNGWGAMCFAGGQVFRGMDFPDLEIYDRVGGGDSFASGFIYGLLSGFDIQNALNYGIAHGALAMTTPGDTSMAKEFEVEALVAGKSARVVR